MYLVALVYIVFWGRVKAYRSMDNNLHAIEF